MSNPGLAMPPAGSGCWEEALALCSFALHVSRSLHLQSIPVLNAQQTTPVPATNLPDTLSSSRFNTVSAFNTVPNLLHRRHFAAAHVCQASCKQHVIGSLCAASQKRAEWPNSAGHLFFTIWRLQCVWLQLSNLIWCQSTMLSSPSSGWRPERNSPMELSAASCSLLDFIPKSRKIRPRVPQLH